MNALSFTDYLRHLILAHGWSPSDTPGHALLAKTFGPVEVMMFSRNETKPAREIQSNVLVLFGADALITSTGYGAIALAAAGPDNGVATFIYLKTPDEETVSELVVLVRTGDADSVADRAALARRWDLSRTNLIEQLMHRFARDREWALIDGMVSTQGFELHYDFVDRNTSNPLIFGREDRRYYHLRDDGYSEDRYEYHDIFVVDGSMVALASAYYPEYADDESDGRLYLLLRQPGHESDPRFIPEGMTPEDDIPNDVDSLVREYISKIVDVEVTEAFRHAEVAPATLVDRIARQIMTVRERLAKHDAKVLDCLLDTCDTLAQSADSLWREAALKLVQRDTPLPLKRIDWTMESGIGDEGQAYETIERIEMVFVRPDGTELTLSLAPWSELELDELDPTDLSLLFPGKTLEDIDHESLPCALSHARLLDLIYLVHRQGEESLTFEVEDPQSEETPKEASA